MLNAALNLALVCCWWGTRDRLHFPLWIPTKTREGGDNWEFREDIIDKNEHMVKVVQNDVPTTECN